MKKFTFLSIITLAILTFSQASFAASFNKSAGASYMVIEGTIVKVDQSKSRFVIKDKDDGKTYGLSAFKSQLGSLNEGDHAKVTVPRPGNLATRITK